jgi:hypothetical protein
MNIRKPMAALAMASSLVLLSIGAAQASVPTSSWNTSGLKEVVSLSGKYNWSADGLGTMSGTGNLRFEKPTGGTVKAAYMIAAQVRPAAEPTLGQPSNFKINNQAVTFTQAAMDSGSGYNFNNYFADVTSLVKTTLDGAAVGVGSIPADEGVSNESDPMVEGLELVVVWNDPSVDQSTVMIEFGTSNPAGDTFSLDFPALTQPQTNDLEMSIGDSYSYQSPSDSPSSTQASTIKVNGSLMTDIAGGFDDCSTFVSDPEACQDGSLITVGGVGDSTADPVLPTPDPIGAQPDDELYSLSPFVHVGDTQISVETRNASNDDNIFSAVFYLKHVLAHNSASPTTTTTAPVTPTTAGAGLTTTTAANTPTTTTPLAQTGFSGRTWLFAAGSLLALGGLVLAAPRRRSAK